ncbi:MAG: hypothetical protein CO189_03230 [candidate division Zixibacteria bacterium CG_4_9_14_3_um_filter_46_8]|nr:MAG: hypothetical protein CO189_03230 [candidate division Zixibacteria bacterium CG_4_9_14_3_um_filter_46_8]
MRWKIFLTFMVCFSPIVCSAQIREPAVAGQFYPSKPAELRSTIEEYLNNVPSGQGVKGELVALIAPHAGYIYSGQTAAYSYKLLLGRKFDAIILISISHFYPFEGISIWESGEWRTPLGLVTIDGNIAKALADYSPLIRFEKRAHLREHSLEVQIPFIQVVQPSVPIVPIVIGGADSGILHTLASALAKATKNKKILIIASTDLAHYVSRDKADKMDRIGIEYLKKFQYKEFLSSLNSGETQFCGGRAVAAVIEAASLLGADNFQQLKHNDSGYATGDSSSVVSYLAAAITKTGTESSEDNAMEKRKHAFVLNDQQEKVLLKIAREAIKNAVENKTTSISPSMTDPLLAAKCGAFVTITEDDQLRGCIGYTEAYKPLYQTVHECAISAALHDYRFTPLQANELSKIHLEISVLTPLEVVDNIEEIEVGRDGLMISKGRNRGLLLPQVATEYGWDRVTFLEQTCRKAGLPSNSYKDSEAIIYSFQALAFGE